MRRSGSGRCRRGTHDCVRLIYQKGDRLFVPVENMDLLWRFGTPGETVQLDKLGGTAWPKRLERVREAMREAAGELISTAARREMAEVELIVPPRASYRRFSPVSYTETDDQQSAIDDVLADLASGKLMDRLVVGDVGFGKTEVALRAAFAVASSGRQVAVVAPTTPSPGSMPTSSASVSPVSAMRSPCCRVLPARMMRKKRGAGSPTAKPAS